MRRNRKDFGKLKVGTVTCTRKASQGLCVVANMTGFKHSEATLNGFHSIFPTERVSKNEGNN